jgi:hypothetical protein
VTSTCRRGHTNPVRDNVGACGTCRTDDARERSQLIRAAAAHLGLTRREYEATHGGGRVTARAILAGPPAAPAPEQCRNGHPRTEQNTGHRTVNGKTIRYCVVCRTASRNASRERERAAKAEQPPPPPRPRKPHNWAYRQRLLALREAARVRAAAEVPHVAHLDPEQRDWDGLSVLALCSCGWRETHATPDRARAALKDHTETRPDVLWVRGDRVDHDWQVTA